MDFQKLLTGNIKTFTEDEYYVWCGSMFEQSGKYYLFHMGNHGNGDWWTHRNNQRIGMAWAYDPEGEWHFADRPTIDVSESGFDSLMVSNPTMTETPNGKLLMVYKSSAASPSPGLRAENSRRSDAR